MTTDTNDTSNVTPIMALERRRQEHGERVAMVQPLGPGVIRRYTWNEVADEAYRMAAHLRAQGINQGDRVALISKNCAEWIIADLAIWVVGGVSVPLYPTLAAESVHHILEHSEARLLFIGKLDDWPAMKDGVPDDMKRVALSLAPDSVRASGPLWEDIIKAQSPLAEPAKPEPDDLATIIYTSGTTGTPKGVMQQYKSLSGVGGKAASVYGMTADDRLISYLPLSHVAERTAVEMVSLYTGNTIYFAESLETFGDDIKRAKPTLFFAVPRIWSKFYQRASEAISPKKLNVLLKIPLLNNIIRRKVLTAMGLEECRIAMSGAAPLSIDIINWFNSLGLEILEVYGMTENMGWSHTTGEGEQSVGWVGTPNEGVECRIDEKGEILVRAISNMSGYYKQPELTAEVLSPDGWLRTGDVGEIDGNGRLRITGRVKEIFKTDKGKYVAPAPIENRLVSLPGVEMACVVGANMPQPIALLNLTPEEQARYAKGGAARQAFTAKLQALLKNVNEQIAPHERLEALIVCKLTWTQENGLITPTLKLKRSELEKHYAEQLPGWSIQHGVVWEQ